MEFTARTMPTSTDRDNWKSGELRVLPGYAGTAARRFNSTTLVTRVRGRLLLLIRRRVLDAVEHLADALVGHCLKDSNFGLLPGSQQRICVCQKFLLVRQAVRIRLVQF